MTQERMEELTNLGVKLISERLPEDEYVDDCGYSECVVEVPVYKNSNPDQWAHIFRWRYDESLHEDVETQLRKRINEAYFK